MGLMMRNKLTVLCSAVRLKYAESATEIEGFLLLMVQQSIQALAVELNKISASPYLTNLLIGETVLGSGASLNCATPNKCTCPK
jgi:hypothetical protein